MLGPDIRQQVRNCHRAADGADVHDPPVTAQVGQGGERRVHHAEIVDVHRLAKVLHAHRIERAHLDDSRVVDQDVDAAEALHGLADEGGCLLGIADVAGDGEDAGVPDSQLGARPFQLRRIARADRHARSLARQLARHHQPEPARAPGDQDHPPRERERWKGSPQRHQGAPRACRPKPAPADPHLPHLPQKGRHSTNARNPLTVLARSAAG